MRAKLKSAVLGLGTMGRVHAEAWSHIEDAELVGVVDLDREKAQTVASQYNLQAFSDFSTLIEQSDVEVVDICLPTYLHKEYVAAAAKAGKHVICEKPLGLNVQEAHEMINLCEAQGVKLFVAQVVRFFPEYVQATEQVRRGKIGNAGVVRLTRGGSFPHGWNNWYADEDKSGRLILDSMIHDFDWLRWTFGDVQRVMTRQASYSDGKKDLDYALVTLRMLDGTIAHVEGTWAHTGFHTSYEITGDKGMLSYDSQEGVPLTMQLHSGDRQSEQSGVPVPESPLTESPYLRELKHFTDCIRTGNPPIVTADDALKAVEIAQAALASAASGKPVELSKMGGGVR
ncbi:dehydrogenase [Pullulanibacillus camelliae]|uniref:Dehydrogenase n=1 Tax=Pullulanibacillus camelliae TaxID=1707096 RepID=A0A8J2VDU5_9BACL|nr:Gfo/Idh/MocA family oxidoreductase [Pullulanibacillus camelliae]GGE26850.1 dehydrogenase [Pullulanibacillus camelliae]